MLTARLLRAMWPDGNSRVPGLIEAIAAQATVLFPKFGFDSPLTIAHAMAQFTAECGGGRNLTENINYTPERAVVVWPSRFSSAADCLTKVGSFRGDPDFRFKLINNVYGSRNGNRPGTDDGVRYIGRGLAQITGRGNYKALADKLGGRLDLVARPELVIAAENALECGLADLVLCGCLPHAKADNLLNVSALLNVGRLVSSSSSVNGFAERKAALKLWKLALGVEKPALHSETWVQVSLNALGADPALVPDGAFGGRSRASLKIFQEAHDVTPDGRITQKTLAALDAALAQL